MSSPDFAIGDIQGCRQSFEALLHLLQEDQAPPQVILLGDLINRGPDSLGVLRWAYAKRVRTVLGNHDLHFLALAAGLRQASASDTLAELLDAPDLEDLIDWLRSQPLAILENNHLFVHAGVLPQWDAEQVITLADEVHQALSGPDWRNFLANMYGNTPTRWSPSLRGNERLRVIVNALTRLRFCSVEGEMEFATKEGLGAAPEGYLPWFDVPGRRTENLTVVFGHWSTLGFIERSNLLGLDTGCVWGGQLTAVRLADRARYQVACPQAAMPGPR
jgi:bis(5'-nucleosyl)-tetraphosphatase (symmetrical)